MAMVRRRAWYGGTVQGGGFRFTTRRVADRRDVTGYVKNLPDGRVEVVAEGPSEEVEAFLADVRRAMSGYIHEAQIVEEPPTGAFDGFGVTF